MSSCSRMLGVLLYVAAATSCADKVVSDPELERQSARRPGWQQSQVGFQGRVVESRVRSLDPRVPGPDSYIQGDWGAMGGPVAYQDFGEYRTEFFYADERSGEYFKADPLITRAFKPAFGAQTRNRTRRVVAEARLLEVGSDGTYPAGQAIIEEFHYGVDGDLVYYAKSIIRRNQRYSEILAIGQKSREYYELYPVLGDLSAVSR